MNQSFPGFILKAVLTTKSTARPSAATKIQVATESTEDTEKFKSLTADYADYAD